MLRFSDYFGLGKTQAQLDFIDIPLQTDIHLFLDPYALHIGRAPWFIEANNLVVDFFNHLLEAIKAGDEFSAVRLLHNMREPKDQVQDFTQKHPDILVKYKMAKSEKSQPLSDYDLEETQQMARELFICDTENDLKRIPVGARDANRFHELCIGSLTTIFGNWLINPKK